MFKYALKNAGLQIDYNEITRILLVDDQEVSLTESERRIFLGFLRSQGRVLSYQDIKEECNWASDVSSNQIRTHITELRKKLGDTDRQFIRTLHRQGYQLSAPISVIDLEPDLSTKDSIYRVGSKVPDGAAFKLEKLLSQAGGVEVWSAINADDDRRIYKIGVSGVGVRALRTEHSITGLVMGKAGGAGSFRRCLHSQFGEQPFYTVFEFVPYDFEEWAQSGALQKLNLTDRLQVFRQMTTAVEILHELRVVHRDIRPKNFVVYPGSDGGVPIIKLIDFGHSGFLDGKALERLGAQMDGLSLQHGSVGGGVGVGSIEYYAPELNRGTLPSFATDVYALGVLLFKFICGDIDQNFGTGWASQVEDIVLREDVESLTHNEVSRRPDSAKQIMGLLNSLDERRVRRAELAEERARLETLEAEKTRSEAQKPFRRAAAAFLCLGIIASSIFAVQASRAEARAVAAQQIAEAAAQSERAAADILVSVVDRLDPNKQLHPPGELSRDVLQLAVSSSQTRQQLSTDTQFLLSQRLAEISAAVLAYSAQEEEYRRLIRLAGDKFGVDSEEGARFQYLLSISLAAQSRVEEAQGASLEADEIYAALASPSAELNYQRAYSRGRLATHEFKFEEAAKHYRDAISLSSEFESANPDDVLLVETYLGQSLVRGGQMEEGLELLERLYQEIESETAKAADWRSILLSRTYGTALVDSGAGAASLPVLEQLVGSLEQRFGAKSVPVAQALLSLARAFDLETQYAKAQDTFERAADLSCNAVQPQAQICLSARLNGAIVGAKLGEHESTIITLNAVRAEVVEMGLGAEMLLDYYKAIALLRTKRHREAISLAETLDADYLSRISPGAYWQQQIRAIILSSTYHLGDVDRAVELEVMIEEIRELGAPKDLTDDLASYLE